MRPILPRQCIPTAKQPMAKRLTPRGRENGKRAGEIGFAASLRGEDLSRHFGQGGGRVNSVFRTRRPATREMKRSRTSRFTASVPAISARAIAVVVLLALCEATPAGSDNAQLGPSNAHRKPVSPWRQPA